MKVDVARLPAVDIGRSEESGGQCEAGEEALCLLDDRFSVEVTFVDPNLDPPDNAKRARVAPSLTTANTGFFWFFNRENIELAVKVLDGRAINGSFWVLYGGLSGRGVRDDGGRHRHGRGRLVRERSAAVSAGGSTSSRSSPPDRGGGGDSACYAAPTPMLPVRRALVSVFDKAGLEDLGRGWRNSASRSSPPAAPPGGSRPAECP